MQSREAQGRDSRDLLEQTSQTTSGLIKIYGTYHRSGSSANKRIDIALRYIYGIGPVNAKEVLERANIDPAIRAKDLTEQQLSQIVHAIQEGKYVIEGDLRRELGMNLKRLQGIRCYRGVPPSAQPAGAWSTYANQRPHSEGSAQDGRCAAQPERKAGIT